MLANLFVLVLVSKSALHEQMCDQFTSTFVTWVTNVRRIPQGRSDFLAIDCAFLALHKPKQVF